MMVGLPETPIGSVLWKGEGSIALEVLPEARTEGDAPSVEIFDSGKFIFLGYQFANF